MASYRRNVNHFRPSYRTEKVIFSGEAGVGKTTMFYRLQGDTGLSSRHSKSIQHQDIFKKAIQLEGGQYLELSFWDTAGVERFQQTLSSSHYHNAKVALFVYDVADSSTLHALTRWIKEARRFQPHIAGLLVGNKIDLSDEDDFVSEETERSFAAANNLHVVKRTSAHTGVGLVELLDSVVEELQPQGDDCFDSSSLLTESQYSSRRGLCCS